MNNKQIKEIIYYLKLNYQHAYKNFSDTDMQMTVKLWGEYLKDCDSEIIMQVIKKIIGTSKFPPVIADVMDEYKLLVREIKLKARQAKEKIEMEEHRLLVEAERAEERLVLGKYEELSEENKIRVDCIVNKELGVNDTLRKYQGFVDNCKCNAIKSVLKSIGECKK